MSDTSQGPGWWQASDGKWYPPEQGQAPQAPSSPQYAAPAMGGGPVTGGGPEAYASWGQRVVATLIDGGFMLAVVVVLGIVALVGFAIADVLGVLLYIVTGLVALGFGLYIGALNGAGGSPGKRLTGLRVVKKDTGQPLGPGMGIARWAIYIPIGIIPCVGFIAQIVNLLFPLWDAERQTWNDKAVGSVVLPDQPQQSFGAHLFRL